MIPDGYTPLILLNDRAYPASIVEVDVTLDGADHYDHPYKWGWNGRQPDPVEILPTGQLVQMIKYHSLEIGTMRFTFLVSLT